MVILILSTMKYLEKQSNVYSAVIKTPIKTDAYAKPEPTISA